MELNDIYDENRNLTGRFHRRGSKWHPGEYGLVVCVWVHNGRGQLLLTRRAPGKSFPHTWENSGGAAQAGETSIQAIRRELFEETGISAREEEFEFLSTNRENHYFYDHYCLKKDVPLDEITLLPGETDGAKWVTFPQIHEMIERRQICQIIANQFFAEEEKLLARQNAQD